MYAMPQTQSAFASKARRSLEQALVNNPSALTDLASSVPTQTLTWSCADARKVCISVRRDDLVDAQLGGNKLYKLWGHLCDYAQHHQGAPIVSFGGAFSNHLYALAAAGALLNIPTIGVVRGEEPKHYSPTLRDVSAMGMKLLFVSRSAYRNRAQQQFREALSAEHNIPLRAYWIPEGGGGEAGRRGCIELGKVLATARADAIIHACGTGTTLAGIAQGMLYLGSARQSPNLIGIAALNSGKSVAMLMQETVNAVPQHNLSWAVTNQYHVRGFARTSPPLDSFINQFYAETGLEIDHVYTGKVFFALSKMIDAEFFSEGSQVLVVHSGGMQGSRKIQK